MKSNRYKTTATWLWALPVVAGLVFSPQAQADSQQCQALAKVPPASATPTSSDKIPVSITADQIEFPERSVVRLKGYTKLIRGGHRVYADELIYDKRAESVEARGVVKFETSKGDVIQTGLLRYDVRSNKAESGPARFRLTSRKLDRIADSRPVSAYGTASRVAFEGEHTMYLEDVQITTCLDGRDDMTFKADSLKIDLDKGFRVANHVKLQILAPERHLNIDELLN